MSAESPQSLAYSPVFCIGSFQSLSPSSRTITWTRCTVSATAFFVPTIAGPVLDQVMTSELRGLSPSPLSSSVNP